MGGQVQQSGLPNFSKELKVQKKEEELVQETVKHTEHSLKDETTCLEDSMPEIEAETEVATQKKLSTKEPTTERNEKKAVEVPTNEDTEANSEPSVRHKTPGSEESIPAEMETKHNGLFSSIKKPPVEKGENKVLSLAANECKIEKTEPTAKHKTSGPKETEVAEKNLSNSTKKEATPEEEEEKFARIPSKEDTLGMIEQRRRATQERIQAHLNGLDKSKEPTPVKEVKKVTQIPTQEDTVAKTEPAITHRTSGPQDLAPAEKEVAETNLTKEEAAPEKEEKKEAETPTKEDSVKMIEQKETHKTSGSEDMRPAERETKVAETKLANMTKEPIPEKDETKVAQAFTNGEIEAVTSKTCGSEDSMPTETETKLVQLKQHRSIKKATRKKEEKEMANFLTNEHIVEGLKDLSPAENLPIMIKEEAAPEKEKKKDAEIKEPPAEEKTFGPEDSIEAEKETEVTEKKLPNLIKIKHIKKRSKRFKQRRRQ